MGSPSVSKIDTALIGVTRLGFDTAPFIYFVERNPKYLALTREIIRRVDTGIVAGYSSVISLTEVLTQPLRLGNAALANEYRNLLLHSRNFTLLPIDVGMAESAANLHARYGLRTPDALQIATVLSAKCEVLLTNDTNLKRVTELRILVLDDLEL
jgi:predicted nucleic acid-binding protein